jgi:hypothetical protein
MRFLILDTAYSDFLVSLYAEHPGLEKQDYVSQARIREESLFGQTSFYAANLRALGHESWDVEVNNEPLQRAWAHEHGLEPTNATRWQARLRRGVLPWISRVADRRWMYQILAEQIRQYQPDVVINYAMELDGAFFREMKPSMRLLVGHHAAPIPPGSDFGAYDLVLSLVDNFVAHFRRQGLHSELFRQGFEPCVLRRLGSVGRPVDVSFVGNLHSNHTARQQWLTHMCEQIPVDVWMGSASRIPKTSPIRRRYHGAAWGTAMYQVLHSSLITLNHHVDVAGRYAGNIRLFEATGVGTLMITDWKENLHEIFEPGKEIIAYHTPEECVELTQYYLDHPDERRTIAQAGQQRVLREHTYRHRMQQLIDTVERCLS